MVFGNYTREWHGNPVVFAVQKGAFFLDIADHMNLPSAPEPCLLGTNIAVKSSISKELIIPVILCDFIDVHY